MTRFAFIWIIVSVGFALWFHAHEEAARRNEISTATAHALYLGVYNGCRTNNGIRRQMVALAERLHGIRVTVPEQHCRQEAERVVDRYRFDAPHEDVVHFLP